MLALRCANADEDRQPVDHRIGYRFFPNSPLLRDSTVTVYDSSSVGIMRLLDRIQDATVIHAAWNTFIAPQLQMALVSQLHSHPGARVFLVMDQHDFERFPDSVEPILNANVAGAIRFENEQRPYSGAFNTSEGKHGQMRNNFMLFQNLAPDGPDDGAFGLLFSTGAFPMNPALPSISEAVWLYGDSSLYERFLGYWETIVEGNSPILSAQSHTYSNLHDHQAWFFPDVDAAGAAAALLQPLEQGLESTRQPAKVRLSLTGIDRCHIPVLHALSRMQQAQEIDLKIAIAREIYLHPAVATAIDGFEKGTVRYFPQVQPAMQSRMLLIDGPYRLAQDGPIEARKLSFFLGGDLYLSDLEANSMTWLRIADADLLESAQQHFDQIWSISADTAIYPILSRPQLQNCD